MQEAEGSRLFLQKKIINEFTEFSENHSGKTLVFHPMDLHVACPVIESIERMFPSSEYEYEFR